MYGYGTTNLQGDCDFLKNIEVSDLEIGIQGAVESVANVLTWLMPMAFRSVGMEDIFLTARFRLRGTRRSLR
jgi:hypothetical protein